MILHFDKHDVITLTKTMKLNNFRPIKSEPIDDFEEFVQEAVNLDQTDDLFVPRYPQAEADRIMDLIREQVDERVAFFTAHYQHQINDLKEELKNKEIEICELTKTVADLEEEVTVRLESLEEGCEKIKECVKENVEDVGYVQEEFGKSSFDLWDHIEKMNERIIELESKTNDDLWETIADNYEEQVEDYNTMSENIGKLVAEQKNIEGRLTNVVTHLHDVEERGRMDFLGEIKDLVKTLQSIASNNVLKISVLSERVDALDQDEKIRLMNSSMEKLEKKMRKLEKKTDATRRFHNARISIVEKDADNALKILATF